MFKKATSHADQSECVAYLARHCSEIRAKLILPDTDARVVSMDNIKGVAFAGQMVLNLLDSWARGDETIRHCIPQLIGLAPVTKAAVDAAGGMLNKSSKLALVLLGQFQIENCLRNIGLAIGVKMSGSGFFAVAKPVLGYLGLAQHLVVLNVPALIRNSLHSNGIHNGYQGSDTTVTIEGIQYEFVHGRRVQCTDWEHVAHALDASVGILGDVFDSAAVKLQLTIADQYAEEITALPPGP